MTSTQTGIGSLAFAKLVEDAATFAMRICTDAPGDRPSLPLALASTSKDLDTVFASGSYDSSNDTLETIDRAKALTDEFEQTGAIEKSDMAISILESILDLTPQDDPDRHRLLFYLAFTLCRRIEVQVSGKRSESLLELHRILTRCVFLLRQAVNASPPNLQIKIHYLGQLGHTVTLWSTLESSQWAICQVLALLHHLETADEITDDPPIETLNVSGFASAVVMASTLSTAYSLTKDPIYRSKGRDVYRRTLGSMRELLPLDAVISPVESMPFFQQLRALQFIQADLIPFILQVMALLMQRLVEVPLSAVVGRRAAALAIEKNFIKQGVEWLEQCLMLVWGQLHFRAPAPLKAVQDQESAGGVTGQIILAFLGILVYVDVVTDDNASVAHPEQIAYFIIDAWLQARQTADPASQSLFKPPSFSHIARAASTAPVVVLNLWGSQCDALLLRANHDPKRIPLPGVTEDFAGILQENLRQGLRLDHFTSRGDEGTEYRGLSPTSELSDIHRVLAALWTRVVKPIIDQMELQPIEDAALDPPRLIWCPTGPTSFFPLHAAGLYDSQENGTKVYEYVASSYTPTLTVLADAHDTLPARATEPFKGILAVSQPSAEGQTPIPKTVDEVQALVDAVKEIGSPDERFPLQWLNGAEATKDAVLSGMQSSTWVHLACHARQYPLNTSESAFMLAHGETLSLADISEHASAGGELAFLSACQTAAGDFDLSEEGVHLAAGMLVAGYRSVIATIWSVHDKDAPIVAKAVYRRLLGGGQVSRTSTALALHHATRLLRESEGVGQDQLLRWAPFVHLGI